MKKFAQMSALAYICIGLMIQMKGTGAVPFFISVP